MMRNKTLSDSLQFSPFMLYALPSRVVKRSTATEDQSHLLSLATTSC